jgi:hypothetical protein
MERQTYRKKDERTDGQRDNWIDMKKLIVAFRNFANATKI